MEGPTGCYGEPPGRRIVAHNGRNLCKTRQRRIFKSGQVGSDWFYMYLYDSDSVFFPFKLLHFCFFFFFSDFLTCQSLSFHRLAEFLRRGLPFSSPFSCFWAISCSGLKYCTWVFLVHLELLSVWLQWVQGNLSLSILIGLLNFHAVLGFFI